MRRILCLDMDAFFASVEVATRPKLKGRPVAVAGNTVILSPTYEARKWGIKTGFSTWEAKKVCPEITIIKANNAKYSYVSGKINAFLKSITPTATMYSIDEAFLDITDLDISSASIGYKIKSWLRLKLHITGSVGIGPSYITAKQATKVKKPDGYFEVLEDDRLIFMDRFKLIDLWGIGRRWMKRLNSMGLFTPAEVRAYGEDAFLKQYGIPGQVIYYKCCGLDSDKPVPREEDEYKSIGHSTTLPHNISEKRVLLAYLLQLSEAVSYRARNLGYAGRIVHLYVRTGEWEGYSFRKNLQFYTSATHHIYHAVREVYEENFGDNVPMRVLGVSLGELHPGAVLANLEDMMQGKDDKLTRMYRAVDEVNHVVENGLLRCSALMTDYRGRKVISPARPTTWYDENELEI